MESSDTTAVSSTTTFHSFSPTSSSPPLAAAVGHSPCAACKILRRRCTEKCVLAPYFPPSEPLKFATAHRVFGASNIIKLLQELPESQRADAVSSMVYEAGARVRDPVYGCTGAICQLQKQADELRAQLARAHAEILNLRAQHKNLFALIRAAGSRQALHPAAAATTSPGSPNLYGFSHDPRDDGALSVDDDDDFAYAGHGSIWDDLTPLDL